MPPQPNIVTLFQFDGTSLHLDSDEAKKQIEEMGDGKFDFINFFIKIFNFPYQLININA